MVWMSARIEESACWFSRVSVRPRPGVALPEAAANARLDILPVGWPCRAFASAIRALTISRASSIDSMKSGWNFSRMPVMNCSSITMSMMSASVTSALYSAALMARISLGRRLT